MARFEKKIRPLKDEDADLDLTHEDAKEKDGLDPEETIITLGKHAGGNRVLSKGLKYPSLILARKKLPHMLNFGGTGTGKSETNYRIGFLIARETKWPIAYLDAKGDLEAAERYAWLMKKAGRQMFMFPNEHFDGFRGSGDEVFNRLMEVVPFVMKSVGARYYTDKAIVMLRIICEDYPEPPRSSRELLERLSPDMMDFDIQKQIEFEGVDVNAMSQIKMRFAAYFRQVKNYLDGKRYWSEIDTAYFMFNSLGGSEESQSMAAWIFSSLAQYLVKDKPRDQPFVVFVDETAAIVGTTSLPLLLEQSRAFGTAFFLTLQTLDGFPEPSEQTRILGNVGIVLLHKTLEPDRLANLVAQKYQMDLMFRQGNGELSQPDLQYRLQKGPGLDVDAIKRLGIGEMWALANADCELVKVARSPIGKLALPAIEPVEFRGPRFLDLPPELRAGPPDAGEQIEGAYGEARADPLPDLSALRLDE